MIKHVLVILVVSLCVLGCPNPNHVENTTEFVPDLPEFSDLPPNPSEAEREALHGVARCGSLISQDLIADPGHNPSLLKKNDDLWRTLIEWLSVPDGRLRKVDVESYDEYADRLLLEAGKTREAYIKWKAEYKANREKYEEIRKNNILLARDKDEANQEILARREAMMKMEEELEAYKKKEHKILFWGINVFGFLGISGVVIIFLKYGFRGGMMATILMGALYSGGIAAYIWRVHPEFVKLGAILGTALLIILGIAYAFWGTLIEKAFRRQVEVHQTVREKLPEDVREQVDNKFREEGGRDIMRNLAITKFKKDRNIARVAERRAIDARDRSRDGQVS